MAIVWAQWGGWIGLWLAAAVVAALLSGVLRSARFKGWLGERRVRGWLAQGLAPANYTCLHNVTVRLADGSTTQIDHVVVSRYGIFVLETKHLQGWIFGAEKQPTWTQTIYRHRSSFQNPLRQNWRHIKALEEVLQLPLAQLHSVVVFTADCHFKTAMPANVLQGRACVGWILSHNQVVGDDEQVAVWVHALRATRLPQTRAIHRAHVAHLQARYANPHGPTPRTDSATARRKVLPSHQRSVQRKTGAGAAVAVPVEGIVASNVKAVANAVWPPVAAPAQVPLWAQAPMARDSASLGPKEVLPETSQDAIAPQSAPVMSAPPRTVPACPECQSDLVARSLADVQGQVRYFWRCSQFPQCRFIHSEGPKVAKKETPRADLVSV